MEYTPFKLDPKSKLWDEVCQCGHKRVQHFVGGPISDCDKCACREFNAAPTRKGGT